MTSPTMPLRALAPLGSICCEQKNLVLFVCRLMLWPSRQVLARPFEVDLQES